MEYIGFFVVVFLLLLFCLFFFFFFFCVLVFVVVLRSKHTHTHTKGSSERLFILTRTHSMHIFGDRPPPSTPPKIPPPPPPKKINIKKMEEIQKLKKIFVLFLFLFCFQFVCCCWGLGGEGGLYYTLSDLTTSDGRKQECKELGKSMIIKKRTLITLWSRTEYVICEARSSAFS